MTDAEIAAMLAGSVCHTNKPMERCRNEILETITRIRTDEREACAQVCDQISDELGQENHVQLVSECAAAIRALDDA